MTSSGVKSTMLLGTPVRLCCSTILLNTSNASWIGLPPPVPRQVVMDGRRMGNLEREFGWKAERRHAPLRANSWVFLIMVNAADDFSSLNPDSLVKLPEERMVGHAQCGIRSAVLEQGLT